MKKNRSNSTYQPLNDKVSVSLAEVIAINARNARLNQGYDNLKKLNPQQTQAPIDYQDGKTRDIVSRMMLNDALARVGRYHFDTNLFASAAHSVGVIFKSNVENKDSGYEYGIFIPYFYESAVLSCIQEHIAKCEYNLLRNLPINAINLNTENESKDNLIVDLKAVQSLMGQIHREVSDEFKKIETKNREYPSSVSIIDPVTARDYSKALKVAREYAKGFIAMIDAELKAPGAKNNPILVCQRLKALSLAISDLQGILGHRHINLNRIAVIASDENSNYEGAQRVFQEQKELILEMQGLPEDLKAIVLSADVTKPSKDAEFLNKIEPYLDGRPQLVELKEKFESCINHRDSESRRNHQAYIQLFGHDNSEEKHMEHRMGTYNANSKETLDTLASDDEMQTVIRLIGRAAGNLQVLKDEPLTQESLEYVKTQFEPEIDNDTLPVLVANQRLRIESEWGKEWLEKKDSVERLAKAIAKADVGFPFDGVTDDQLQAVIKNEMAKVPEKLRDFMRVEGVNFIREVIAVTNKLLGENTDIKVKPEVEFSKKFADKLAIVWQKIREAEVQFQVAILVDNVKTHGVSEAQRNTIATKVAERKVAESGLTSEEKIGQNAILSADQYRKAADNTSSTLRRVNQDMSVKTLSVDNQAKPVPVPVSQPPLPPPLRPLGDKSQYAISRLAAKSGGKIPNVTWIKKKTEAPAQTANSVAAAEEPKEKDSRSTPSFGK